MSRCGQLDSYLEYGELGRGVQILHNQKSGSRTRAKRKGPGLTLSQQGLVTFLHLL